MRVAVVGLYRSGSSFWAGCLHHLGVDMGHPFWENDVENHPDNHYEPWDLSIGLRRAWHEPEGEADWPIEDRINLLRDWIVGREAGGSICGAKHPLFCLCVDDIYEAWGEQTVIIRSFRPLEDSVASLLRTTFPWSELDKYRIQHKLWRAASEYFKRRPPDLCLEISKMQDEFLRRTAIDQIIERLELKPTKEQIRNAINGYRTTG